MTIGYFQSAEDELDTGACNRMGIDFTRRITGGGAVFHDNELTYSFITREFPQNIKESYEWVCGPIIKALNHLGFPAQFSGLNDITVNGKKVSGNAQTRKKGVLLQHGTILLRVDTEKMFTLLKVPNEKLKDKMISAVKERVMGLGISPEILGDKIKGCFAEQFSSELVSSEPSKQELELAEQHSNQKFRNREWIFKR